jgi:hypothetical protein
MTSVELRPQDRSISISVMKTEARSIAREGEREEFGGLYVATKNYDPEPVESSLKPAQRRLGPTTHSGPASASLTPVVPASQPPLHPNKSLYHEGHADFVVWRTSHRADDTTRDGSRETGTSLLVVISTIPR